MTKTVTDVRDSAMPVITGRFVLLVAFLSLAVFVAPVHWEFALVIANVMAFLAFAVDVFFAPKPSTVEVRRNLSSVVFLSTESLIQWQVFNPKRYDLELLMTDEIPPSWRAQKRRIHLRIPPKASSKVEIPFIPMRRGRFEIGTIVVRAIGPLGLAGRQGSRHLTDTLRVYPSFKSKREAELRIEKARILEVGLRSVRAYGGGTEFEQLREYSVDDDFRRIDWAATARVAKPIVRTYRAERNQNVICLLDCGRLMASKVEEVPRLEHAMDAVMALSTVASHIGDRVGLMAFDSSVIAEVAPGHESGQFARITEAIYQIEPSLTESNYRGAFSRFAAKYRKRALVVVFTDLEAPVVNEMLQPVLSLIASRHLVVIASVSDPDVAMWASENPIDATAAFRKASAIGMQRERKNTISGLRARGLTVVDSVPQKLAANLADTYINLKATSRL